MPKDEMFGRSSVAASLLSIVCLAYSLSEYPLAATGEVMAELLLVFFSCIGIVTGCLGRRRASGRWGIALSLVSVFVSAATIGSTVFSVFGGRGPW